MRMTFGKRAALSVVAAGSLLIAPAAAHAATDAATDAAAGAAVPVSCAGMVNPVNATGVSTVKSTPMPGRTLELRTGQINGVQYAWTRVQNSQNGDQIWIDISGDGGTTWRQCDLRTIGTGRNYGNALKTVNSSLVCMRAGARPAGVGSSYLTDWWC
ncbi:hypothetical protein [Streptosporangium carneum]|uniref:Uncharacterized protein n=1 Tax=Streptosporangium carneum TaxID=47481 RepID=A0A9W6I2Y3_9ACTN|nr:hypothetical protein [Streptosporangium carneum]GLK10304.1 hypothetical protein GCM10017600_37100 [Streptosporangium carneum]